MTEKELAIELHRDPFIPLRLHMVSGKTIDVLVPHAAWTMNHSLLVFRNPAVDSSRADGYDVLGYNNIERIELLTMGKRQPKRRPA